MKSSTFQYKDVKIARTLRNCNNKVFHKTLLITEIVNLQNKNPTNTVLLEKIIHL